jgi:hypothetical protein
MIIWIYYSKSSPLRYQLLNGFYISLIILSYMFKFLSEVHKVPNHILYSDV